MIYRNRILLCWTPAQITRQCAVGIVAITSFIVINPRLIKSLLSTKQATEPSFRLSGLLLDGLVELVDGRIELLARLLELLVGAVLEGIHLRLGSLRFGFCVIGLAVLASVPVACDTPSPALGESST
jgi:hypothetical protein